MISEDEVDIEEFLAKIHGNKPPYTCPINGCQKVFRSFQTIQKHMNNSHKPKDEIEICEIDIVNDENKNQKLSNDAIRQTSKIITENVQMSYADSKKFVSLQNEKTSFRCNISVSMNIEINDTMPIDSEAYLSKSEADFKKSEVNLSQNLDESNNDINQTPNKPRKAFKRKKIYSSRIFKKPKKSHDVSKQNFDINSNLSAEEANKLPVVPVAIFGEDEGFVELNKTTPDQAESYVHFVEKSTEELNEIVEYDLDEEDLIWLPMCNKYMSGLKNSSIRKIPNKRSSITHSSSNKSNGKSGIITKETMEYVMDRFEKECHFQSHNHKIDEDAVCDICLDGSCENTNAILFCDVCNLAVHQECYGVPYVPEGQWLCRKCFHSPSQPVDCCLCPNKGGAFKQTTDGRWAHVVCALWIPEVRFANITFLEPIDDIEKIESARWKLACYLCKHKNAGACIQCHKSNCYTAFHVTCAQHSGLYMIIEQKDKASGAGGVRKSTYCDVHSPVNHQKVGNGARSMYAHSDNDDDNESKYDSRQRHLKDVRKLLNQRQNYTPPDCFPIITPDKLKQIGQSLKDDISNKNQFIERIHAYWKLKRELRRGVPLLRRLVASSRSNNLSMMSLDDEENSQFRQSLKFWQQLRQDLEKARLLSELSRKREKLKRELFKNFVSINELAIKPFKQLLLNLIDELQAKDTKKVFAQPVTDRIAPSYSKIITNPIDFSKMRLKFKEGAYWSVDQIKSDFDLMMANCQKYNAKGTFFYNVALKQIHESKFIFEKYFKAYNQAGLDKDKGLFADTTIYEMMSSLTNEQDVLPVLETYLTKSLQSTPTETPNKAEIKTQHNPVDVISIEKPPSSNSNKKKTNTTEKIENKKLEFIRARRYRSSTNTTTSTVLPVKTDSNDTILSLSSNTTSCLTESSADNINSGCSSNATNKNSNSNGNVTENAVNTNSSTTSSRYKSSKRSSKSSVLNLPPPICTNSQPTNINITTNASTNSLPQSPSAQLSLSMSSDSTIITTTSSNNNSARGPRKLRRMPATSTSCSSVISVSSSSNNNNHNNKNSNNKKSDNKDDSSSEHSSRILRKRTMNNSNNNSSNVTSTKLVVSSSDVKDSRNDYLHSNNQIERPDSTTELYSNSLKRKKTRAQTKQNRHSTDTSSSVDHNSYHADYKADIGSIENGEIGMSATLNNDCDSSNAVMHTRRRSLDRIRKRRRTTIVNTSSSNDSIASSNNSDSQSNSENYWCAINRNPRVNDVVWVKMPRGSTIPGQIVSTSKIVDVTSKSNSSDTNPSQTHCDDKDKTDNHNTNRGNDVMESSIPTSSSENSNSGNTVTSFVYLIKIFDTRSEVIVPISSIKPLGYSPSLDSKYLTVSKASSRSQHIHRAYKSAIRFACKRLKQPDPYPFDIKDKLSKQNAVSMPPYQLSIYD